MTPKDFTTKGFDSKSKLHIYRTYMTSEDSLPNQPNGLPISSVRWNEHMSQNEIDRVHPPASTQEMLVQQEAQIESLGGGVQRVREAAEDIRFALEEDEGARKDLEGSLDKLMSKVQALNLRVSKFLSRQSTKTKLVCIIIGILILTLLLIFALLV